MRFTVVPYTERAKRYRNLAGREEAYLLRDNWDDYGFKTTFALVYFDGEGERTDIGEVKIMAADMPAGYVAMPETFEGLAHGYGSLGQDQSYYETLLELPEEVRVDILNAMKDVVWDAVVRVELSEDNAYGTSLTRSVGEARFAKHEAILHRQAALTPYDFTYRFPQSGQTIAFRVDPASLPPSNIHVVIGRNGVGKTTLLTSLSSLLRNGRDKRLGKLSFGDDGDAAPKDQFANLITVAFSAFDSFDPPARSTPGRVRSRTAGTRSGISYTYVGLKKRVRVGDERATRNKSEADLQEDFVESTMQCLRSASRPRWQAAMRTLEADPLFAELGLSYLPELRADEVEERAGALFGTASSGHKIVLLTLTRLAELVSDRTLVLVDEPEAHLHPPLVMALVRAISDLLANRNGVAILATHSPVVAQEVPAHCVSLLFRPGEGVTVERPEIETFAENLGALTREIFRVEVTESGHHALIARVVEGSDTLDEVLGAFRDHVGAEGRGARARDASVEGLMLALALPEDDAGTVFAACATRTQSAPKRVALLAQRPQVEDRAKRYLELAEAGALHELDPVEPVGIEAAELIGLYGRVLVRGGERPLYLTLRRCRYNRCPLCGQRDVKSLDHYLAKDQYPELSVFPANLTPSCFECNHAKLNFRAELPEHLLFHPYFDDWSGYRLVRATVNVAARVTVDFDTRAPAEVDPVVVRRVERHFAELGLAELYEQHAAVELVERKGMFRADFASDGAEGLRDELAREAQSRRRFNLNSWQSALYRALSRSEDFYSGGFEQIDEP